MKFFLTLAVALFSTVLVNAQSSSSARSASVTSGSSSRPATVASGSSSRTSSTPSASPSPPSNSTQVNVQVSPGDQLVYSPSNFTAKNGTIVTFNFPNSSITHSVTQGNFSKPCAYLAASGGDPAGFDSGLLSGKQFSLKITNDKEPVFFFCKTKGHCGLGMVGQVAINAPTTGNTYAAYLAAAKALGSSEPVISNTGAVTGGVGATGVSGGAVPSSATTSRSGSSATSSTSRSGASGTSSTPRSSASGTSSTSRSGASGSSSTSTSGASG